jgi:hypothetical protein
MLLIGGVKAVPIDPGVLRTLAPGSDYTAAPSASDVGSGLFSFDYLFDAPADVTATIFASSHQPFPNSGEPAIANLTLTWLDSSFNPLPGLSSIVVTNGSGQTMAGTLVYALAASALAGTDYILRVAGNASNGGRYDFDVIGAQVVSTPLPASLYLFGGALICLAMCARRRRGSDLKSIR